MSLPYSKGTATDPYSAPVESSEQMTKTELFLETLVYSPLNHVTSLVAPRIQYFIELKFCLFDDTF